jgi:hypothetical protein
MILPLRRAHRIIFIILAIVLPALLVVAIAGRPTPARVVLPASIIGDPPHGVASVPEAPR